VESTIKSVGRKSLRALAFASCIASSTTVTTLQPTGALDSLGDINQTGYNPYGIVFTPNGNAIAEIAINTTTGLPGFSTYQFSNGNLPGTPFGGFVNANNTTLSSATGAPCPNAVRWLPNTSMAAALFMLNSASPSSGSLNLNTFCCPAIANGSNASSAPFLGSVNAPFLSGDLSANCCMDVSADGQYMAITDTIYDGNALSSTLYVLSQEGAVLALAALGNTLPGSISISPVSSAGTYYITVGGLDSTLRAFSFTANTVGALNSLGTVTTVSSQNCMAWHPSGLYLAVGTQTPSIRIYTFSANSAPALLGSAYITNLSSSVAALAWAPNGTYLASIDGSSHNVLKFFSFTGSTPALAQLGSSVILAGSGVLISGNFLTWAPNSSFVAAVSSAPALQVFSFNGTSTHAKVGATLTTGLNSPYSVSWSPNGSYLAIGNEGNNSLQLFTFSATSTPTIAASGNPVFTNTGATGLVGASWSPNGNYLAAIDYTNNILQVYAFSGGAFTQVGGNATTGTNPTTVSWHPSGNYITVSSNGTSTAQTFSFNGYSTPTLSAGGGATGLSNPNCGVWSPNGNYFAVVNQSSTTLQAFSWPYNTPTRIGTSLATGTTPKSVTWSPNGLYLATVATNGGSNQLQAWSFSTTSTPTAAALGSAVTTGAGPQSVAFSPNGNYLAVANGTATTLQIFSFAAGTPALVGSANTGTLPVSVAWSPNGNYLAVANQTSATLQIFSFSGGTPIAVGNAAIQGGDSPTGLAWSPNGNYIAVATQSSSALQVYLFSGSTPVQVGSSVSIGGGLNPTSVAWSPNGNYLAVTNVSVSTLQLQIYSFAGSTPVLLGLGTTTSSNPDSVVWSPNGNYLAVATNGTASFQVFYFDGTNTPVLVSTITAVQPISIAWSPNGAYIAVVGNASNTLQFFTAPIFQNGQPLLNQLGNTVSTAAPVTSVAFSPNGNYIATAGSGIQMYSFNNAFSYLTTNTTAITLRGSAVATSAISRQCVWSPTGTYLASVFDNATMSVLSFNPSAPTTPSVVTTANTMPLPTMCAWSPLGNLYNNNYILTASSKNGGLRRMFYFDPFGSTNYSA